LDHLVDAGFDGLLSSQYVAKQRGRFDVTHQPAFVFDADYAEPLSALLFRRTCKGGDHAKNGWLALCWECMVTFGRATRDLYINQAGSAAAGSGKHVEYELFPIIGTPACFYFYNIYIALYACQMVVDAKWSPLIAGGNVVDAVTEDKT